MATTARDARNVRDARDAHDARNVRETLPAMFHVKRRHKSQQNSQIPRRLHEAPSNLEIHAPQPTQPVSRAFSEHLQITSIFTVE